MVEETIIAVSGGFDPLHSGHIDYLDEASSYGKVLVFLNTDAWLVRKKGYKFMGFQERAKILRSIKYVHDVVAADDEDDTVIKSLEKYQPDYFAKGGDRTRANTPELAICLKHDIEILFEIGGNKVQSSSDLVRNVQKN